MTALELYKYITENKIEYKWEDNDGEQDVLLMPLICEVEGLLKLFSENYFSDGGINVVLFKGYLAIWMKDICSYYGIELDDIFVKKKP